MTDAWVYARRSRVQDTHASIADQKDRGREACEDNGWRWDPSRVLEEEVSASRYAKKAREDWPELLAAIGAGRVDVLILWESSRGDRKLGEWATFLDLCQEHGTLIHVISHDRTYDPRNHRDWKTLASEGVDNDHFARRLSVEVKRGKRGAMRRGRPSGQTPYGYRVRYNERTGAPAGWEIIPGRAAIVREIIAAVSSHVPVHAITRGLNERGIPSPRGGDWTTRVVRHIAGNCAYAGLVGLGDGGYAERQPQPDGAAWPPLVTRAEWEKARAVLASRATGPRPGRSKHLLSFLADCECGCPLKIGDPGIYRCVRGDNTVPAEWLEAVAGRAVCARLAREDARDLFALAGDSRTAALKEQIGGLRERRSRYRKKAARGEIGEDALAEIEAELTPEIKAKERELGAVRYVPALAELLTADDVQAVWDGYTLQARREVIAAVTGITVRKTGRRASLAERRDVRRVVFDWQPQKPRG